MIQRRYQVVGYDMEVDGGDVKTIVVSSHATFKQATNEWYRLHAKKGVFGEYDTTGIYDVEQDQHWCYHDDVDEWKHVDPFMVGLLTNTWDKEESFLNLFL